MSMAQEFKKFIMRGNVVDLAIGVVIGAAFAKIVASLVDDIFTPIIGVIVGGLDFSGLAIQVGEARIGYGRFIQASINFVIVGFCLFLVVKAMNRLQERLKIDPVLAEPTPSEKLLAEIRDELKKK